MTQVDFLLYNCGELVTPVAESHAHLGVAGAIEDVGVNGDRLGVDGDGVWSLDAELVIGGATAGLVVNDCLLTVEGNGRVSARSPILAEGVGDAELIGFA